MKKKLLALENCVMTLGTKAKGLLTKKEKGINGIVIEVGLLVVGVVILFLFKDQMSEFVKNLIATCLAKVNTIFNA